ncbi:MAG: hypothetical protein H0Z34_13870 [Brevibacillus sp.]|nr:hypothetical protein [Brevibacillus sp.]
MRVSLYILTGLLCLGLVACTPVSTTPETRTPAHPDAPRPDQETVSRSPYLSLTVTNKQAENLFLSYHLETGEIREVAKTRDSAQYPLGALDLANQHLYYAERDATGSDQLVKLDLATKEKEVLTTDLFAINTIIPVDDRVILAAVTKEKTAVQLASYDLKAQQLTFWVEPEDDDTSVAALSYNPFTQKLYAVLFSDRQRRTLVDKAAEEQADDVLPAVHRIVEYDLEGKERREWYKAEEKIVLVAVSSDTDFALIRSAPMVFKRRELFWYDLHTGEKQKLDIPGLRAIENVQIAPDKQGFYFTGIAESDSEKNAATLGGPPNGLYYYDFKTKQITQLYARPDQYINNFLLLK